VASKSLRTTDIIQNSARCWWLTPVILATQGGDQEDHGSKPAQANSSRNPISKKVIIKKGLAEWLKV
jgi:hypothetical protein